MRTFALLTGLIGIANAACPYMTGEMPQRRASGDATTDTEEYLSQFYLDDTDAFMTTDVGGPIEDQNSLSAGERGPTLLEDFIFRQKIQRFDHERVGISTLMIMAPSLTREHFCRSPSVLFMPAVPVPMECLLHMVTGLT